MSKLFNPEIKLFAQQQFMTGNYTIPKIAKNILDKFSVKVGTTTIDNWNKEIGLSTEEFKELQVKARKNRYVTYSGENSPTGKNSNLKVCYLRYFMSDRSHHRIKNPITNSFYTKEDMMKFWGCDIRNLNKILNDEVYKGITYDSIGVTPDSSKYNGKMWIE